MKNQVEENIKKEENKKMKKIKVTKTKFRSLTSQKVNNNTINIYKKDPIKTLNNESNKSLTHIRSKNRRKYKKIQYKKKSHKTYKT